MNIVNVGYDSTNYYVLADTTPKLLIDAGWPDTLAKLQHQCKRMNIHLPAIKHFICTHYHPDHAGLVQELKQLGLKLIVIEDQVASIPLLKAYMKPENHFRDIDLKDNIALGFAESRAFLKRIGINGEIISTPGHSDDSVTLVLDDGIAFTGDLTHPMAALEDTTTLRESWDKLRALKVKTIYPGHGPAWKLGG
jgi:ribonuclease/clavin/mitogillin